MHTTKVTLKDTGEIRQIKMSRFNPEIHEPLDFVDGEVLEDTVTAEHEVTVEPEAPVEEPKKKRSWKKKII